MIVNPPAQDVEQLTAASLRTDASMQTVDMSA
jgi:hypothetical protein